MASREVVVLEYADLVANKELSDKLLEAWGPGALGIVAVRGVPRFAELYPQVLRLAHGLAHLPEESLKELEDEASMYNSGWSHGKEKLGDTPDFAKGSFYFNPLSDLPGTEEDRTKFPWALPPNRWPKQEHLKALETACKELGRTMHEVGTHLARLIDRTMAARVKEYNLDLGKLLENTPKCKGRLLYYFPPKQDSGSNGQGGTAKEGGSAIAEDGWIGWHNDSGFLTALTPDMYVDDDTGEIIPNPDPDGAGLWIVDRDGGAVHVSIPTDCLAVQVGECTQVVTGGELVATPHCVRGCRPSTTGGRRVARVSCPCFIDVHPDFPLRMPSGCRREDILSRGLSPKVPPLGERWEKDGVTFGEFLGASFKRYYDWALGAKSESTPKRAKESTS